MEFLSYNNTSAADGFGTVLLAALCGFGALALIYGVLVVMNKVHEKKNIEKTEAEKDKDSKISEEKE